MRAGGSCRYEEDEVSVEMGSCETTVGMRAGCRLTVSQLKGEKKAGVKEDSQTCGLDTFPMPHGNP